MLDGLQQTLSGVCDAFLNAVKSAARPHVRRVVRRVHFSAAGYALTLMAAVWCAIAITLAAAQYLPLWASFLCVSAFLAVGAASAFIIPSLENGNRTTGRTNHLEGE
ncbi:hypothetical protein [Hwanghaeella sp.]|uniref:hypothetical protein n=1 Tax=Hwanghaeella sp. TaxID=2605943 RepID=UPI003CCB78BF